MKKLILGIFCLIHALQGMSQVQKQQTYWMRVYARVKLNDKWSWQIEADNRRLFGENQQVQFIAHTHLHRKFGKNTEGSLGFSFSEVWQGDLPVPELRPFQEFYVFQNLSKKWRFSHRFRTEQRWFHNYQSTSLTEGYNFKFRMRYMPRLEYRATSKWIFKSNAELMYHTDDFDQYRYYGGVEYKILTDLSLEAGYLKVYQKRANNKGYFDRNNLRVTLYKDFAVNKMRN
ncbi:MAG: DUF2490 domain-containing protein [Saprospiraceae bacterium]|nr:DUF2490 domain-containing protein [Saprospiraceae bacterium]